MEKLRRKRINSSLDKLRTLLPHSVNIRKDMASLLEQTVEYINIMHTVLNEDKPACLNKVYISYRQKTEEIENFRKSLKKNVASNTSGKRMKSEPGNSSWGQSFTNYGQQPTSPSTDIDQYMKHACMPPTYYDAISTRMGTHPWSHQKMQDSIFPPQATYSGQSQGGLISIPMQSGSSTSRSVFYPSNNVPVKQYDGSFTFTHIAENGEITESQKSANASVAKSESWQTVGQSGDRQNKPVNTAVDMGTGKIITNNQTIAGAPDWYRGMYGGPNLTNTPQCNKNAPVKPPSPLFDENNNASSMDKQTGLNLSKEESVVVSSSPDCPDLQVTLAEKSEISTRGLNCDIASAAAATGILKCGVSPSTKQDFPAMSPQHEMFFNDVGSMQSNMVNQYAPWLAPCSLPPLTLGQNFMSTQPHCSNAVFTSSSSNKETLPGAVSSKSS